MPQRPVHKFEHVHAARTREIRRGAIEVFSGYFWLIFKNVIGWMLVVLSIPVGITAPGPFGFPIFLIGFGLITFPGKRRLTSRVMRGRGLPIEMQVFTFFTAFFAIAATCIVMWLLSDYFYALLDRWDHRLDPRRREWNYSALGVALIFTGLVALGVTWLVMRLALQVVNYILKGMPTIRRKIRPWLQKKGLKILPSRRRKSVDAESVQDPEGEIVELDARHQRRMKAWMVSLLGWGKRALAVSITVAIFAWILKPIILQWPEVREQVISNLSTGILRFALASGMFALFLFVFRALVWRMIVASFGHKLPVPAAVRIWSTSELARYLPGVIWQVVGRVYLVRPYGVSGSVCSITQILELAIFLLANILVALACLLYFGIKNLDGAARGWLFVAAGLLPVLLILLHTKIFYGIINRIMRRLHKPPIVQRLRGYMLVALLFWTILGLLWQSLAIFLILQQPLDLKMQWWWVVAGAYSLAWIAGFLAFWAPGGLGVREVVFIGAIYLILPESVRQSFKPSLEAHPQDIPPTLLAMLAFLSVLLRIWTIAGEFILAAAAYLLDFRGALGKSDAPGRIAMPVARPSDAAV